MDVALDDTMGDGITGEPCSIVNTKFFHQALPVFFHGLDADLEDVCGHLVGISLGNEL